MTLSIKIAHQWHAMCVVQLTLALPSCSEQMLTLIFIDRKVSSSSSILLSMIMIKA